eukprot:1667407-Rhodomonas_salina.1
MRRGGQQEAARGTCWTLGCARARRRGIELEPRALVFGFVLEATECDSSALVIDGLVDVEGAHGWLVAGGRHCLCIVGGHNVVLPPTRTPQPPRTTPPPSV